jgi:hypothetical protein
MIRVEVILSNAVEIWNLSANPDLHWSDNNIAAMRIVYADLQRRATEEGLSLDSLEMLAEDLEFRRTNCPRP